MARGVRLWNVLSARICERFIVLRFVENESRPDIILSTGEAALLALEIKQVLGEADLRSKPSNGHKRLPLKFSKHEKAGGSI